jgi:hypothetical protein
MAPEITRSAAEVDEYLAHKKAERMAKKTWDEAEVASEALWMTADEARSEAAKARTREAVARERAVEALWEATAWARAAAAKAEGSPVEGGRVGRDSMVDARKAKKARKETFEAYMAWTVAQAAVEKSNQ